MRKPVHKRKSVGHFKKNVRKTNVMNVRRPQRGGIRL